ncbi:MULTISPECIES: hypothetical protein [Microbacterium]|uniref:Uncharacterized protein n=4 Tax=Microbacterium TaxID=33882 RepID=A0A4S2DCK8_9MICO|nr:MULTISPECIES: hypothetical protein [Microbacterium]MBD3781258.1 hypothetical protein [Micrococcales bacterium]MBS1907298.1 hypothetical protein [Actinomycetota bacterium]KAB1881667.1 hypothetical protein F6W70_17560 [Microbacterium liquefaciens]MBT8797923.1 hypothetical protein [Microbacterium flavum]MBZ6372997.1 hypothetical protein [Microbacterium hominis]
MDTAVGLVQAYLRVNGYFTVAEYPVLDATGPGGPRTITDLDILAVRLHRAPGASGTVDAPLDPALGAGGGADMIVGEVKEGRPHPNPAMRDPAVLEAAFTRFGCCAPTDAARLVAELLETGRTVAPEGRTIRTVVFGNPTSPPGAGAPWHTVPFARVLRYLEDHLSAHWGILGRTQIKDDTLALLALREKAHRAATGASRQGTDR